MRQPGVRRWHEQVVENPRFSPQKVCEKHCRMVRVYDNDLWDVLRTRGGVAGAGPASGSAEGTLGGEDND